MVLHKTEPFRAGFVSVDEAALNNVLQNIPLRFGIVSANSDFQIVQGAPIEVEAEQSIELRTTVR